MTRLDELLADRGGNYILPLFWQHGEDETALRREMAAIHDSGIGAVCVESRPHPDFCGPRWWQDMDVIMEEARRRGMRVWVMDDLHFPSGFANGWIRDRAPEQKKIYLDERHVDVIGPLAGASIITGNRILPGETLLAIVAAKRDATGAGDGTLIDLTPSLIDGLLYWDIPEGYWRVCYLIETPSYGGHPDYINPVDPASTRVLIDAVYEPHYKHYAADFGATFAGFFTDEPNMGNSPGWADCLIGRKEMVLPWRRELLSLLSAEFGEDATLHLPGLWLENGPSTWRIRYAYMNLITRLYQKAFSDQIGDWCRARGVEFIGHIIEDNDAHARLGCSTGHFFRSMAGQDMAGIDVVMSQLRPGMEKLPTHWCAPEEADPEFFHFALAKLGASHAHLDERKQGRAMCEVFGAYGWAAGVRLMKWLTDHMLVRGINTFSPHAFSPKEFPDRDCPPHFYARGKNPQFRHFGRLMSYTNRLCHLLNGGRHEAEAAILYHAEAEWSGAVMSVKEPLRVLLQRQFDADVVPLDLLLAGARVHQGQLEIGPERFPCLILPWAERQPHAALSRIEEFLQDGLPVLCIREWPLESSEGGDEDLLERIADHALSQCIALEDLPEALRLLGLRGADSSSPAPSLRSYCYRHQDMSVWMFFNESPLDSLDTTVRLAGATAIQAYDAFENQCLSHPYVTEKGGVRVPLSLAPGESRVFIDGKAPEGAARAHWSGTTEAVPVTTGEWQVSCATAEDDPHFTAWQSLEALTNLCRPHLLPTFSGTLRYETTLECASPASNQMIFLDLGEVGETAEVWLNDVYIGTCLSRPYRLNAGGALQGNRNRLRVEVTNHLGYAMRDNASSYYAMEASGLLGPIRLLALTPRNSSED